MNPEDKTEEIRQGMAALVGQRLIRSRNLFATRIFFFGQSNLQDDAALYTLGLECAWRIEKDGAIVVGAEDYYERAQDNADESWEVGMPSGHLQDQGLAELLGEIKGGYVVNTGAGFVVESVDGDRFGGFRIRMGECVLSAFPASRGQMEWILSPPGDRSLILMKGRLSRAGEHPAVEKP